MSKYAHFPFKSATILLVEMIRIGSVSITVIATVPCMSSSQTAIRAISVSHIALNMYSVNISHCILKDKIYRAS